MAEPSCAAALQARDVSISYGRSKVIGGVDLAIRDRAFTALLGPNGSGKSTLLRAFAGMQRLAGGSIELDGRPIARQPVRDVARRIAVLPQGPSTPEGLTVRGLVEQGRYPHRSLFGRWGDADSRAVALALDLTGLNDLAERPLETLSGGQRQRAWIAMTLAQDSGILLLDEPTTFLDLAHQIELLDLVSILVRERGRTVVAVLHDLNQAARYADWIVLLKDGRIAAEGPPVEVLTQAAILQVFDVPCRIIPDPVSNTPLCIPLTRAERD
jgi:iron complex transport system ATP-binding protein